MTKMNRHGSDAAQLLSLTVPIGMMLRQKRKRIINLHKSYAEHAGKVIGFIDTEIDSENASCNKKGERNSVIWHLGVLPEYRKLSVAKNLWEETKKRLLEENIHYCEVWTQEDEPANSFYRKMGFTLEEERSWLRCYSQGCKCATLLNDRLGDIYGPEELIFDAAVSQKDELKDLCYRMDEVRLYSIRF